MRKINSSFKLSANKRLLLKNSIPIYAGIKRYRKISSGDNPLRINTFVEIKVIPHIKTIMKALT
jgi:hypothetical protein